MFIAMNNVPVLFLLDKFICLSLGKGCFCHEYCTSTVPSRQVYLSFGMVGIATWTFTDAIACRQ